MNNAFDSEGLRNLEEGKTKHTAKSESFAEGVLDWLSRLQGRRGVFSV